MYCHGLPQLSQKLYAQNRMIKQLIIFTFYTLLIGSFSFLHAQESPLPKDFVFDTHADMAQYNRYVIPCVNWLEATPLNVNKKERAKMHDFLLHWLQINPDIDVSMPDYALKFHGINSEFLNLFLEGWIRNALQTNNLNTTPCALAGLRTMLLYYNSGKAVGVAPSDYLDNLGQIERSGKLPELFDTAGTAKNTYLYLKTPPHKDKYRYDENYMSFSFYSINMLTYRGIRYRYMLHGYYDDWIVTTDGSVTYPRLPPGTYTFRVQCSMRPDFNNAQERTFSFTVGKPFWREYWFIGLATLLCALLVYLFVRQRERNLKNIERLKQERILFEYEHLKSQVNPHFLFNSLNTLTYLIEKDPSKAIIYTEDLSRLYHHIIAFHDNDLILLSDEFSILEKYISIQKGRFGESLQLKIDIAPEIMRTRKIVPLALQILIENAIKHNVVSANSPLVINISANETEITIKNELRPKLAPEKGRGVGLINIKRRYSLLTKRPVSYGIVENQYIAILPLL